MKIKRYFGTDTRQVMRQIRLEQGPDAVILCCRSTAQGTEIVTAIDDEQAAAEALPARREAKASPVRPTVVRKAEPVSPAPVEALAPPPPGEPPPARELELIRRELRAVQGMLEDRFSRLEAVDLRHGSPVRAQLAGRLIDFGYGTGLVRELTEGLRDDDRQRAWNQLLVRLSRRVADCNDEILEHGGRVVLLGASGAGKTTTAAKLAARYLLRHGRHRVALISTDTQRIGGSQQLRRYAELLQIPLRLVHDRPSMEAALDRFARYPLVIIDTPGLAPRRSALAAQRALFEGLVELKPFLVAALSTDTAVLDKSIASYGDWRLRGAVLTKLDEVDRLGGPVSVLAQRGLPVAYVADGQRIPEDLQPARAARLIALSLTATRSQADGEPAVEVA